VVSLDAFDRLPSVGDSVLAVQPEDDGTEGSARGTVAGMDNVYGLVYVAVDWSTFKVSQKSSRQQHVGTPGFNVSPRGRDNLLRPLGTTANANAFREVAWA
jgi:hypothetical protein